MRSPIFMTLAVCLCGLPAVAAAQDVYFSVGPEIRKMNLPNSNSASVYTSTAFVGDLALCSDNYLYFVEKGPLNRISRLDVTANSPANTRESVFVAENVREIRLTKTCDVLFATATGVFQVNGRSPFSTTATLLETTGAGSGLAIAFNGSRHVSKVSQIVGLAVANGGQGSLTAMAPLPTGGVCASTANKVVCTDKLGTGLSSATALAQLPTLAQLPELDKFQYCEFLTNDAMVCAASVNPEAEITIDRRAGIVHNGTLRLITAVGSSSQIFEASTRGNNAMPVVGVAVGPSSSEPVTTLLGKTHKAEFGPVTMEVTTPQNCRLDIQLLQLTAADATAKLLSATQFSGNSYVLDPGNGGESWIDDVDVKARPGPSCGLSAATPARVIISQFNDGSPNKAVIHCDGASCDVVTEGNFPYSAPDDDGNSGLPDNFSDFLTAAVVPEDPLVSHPIVFNQPLNNAPVVQGDIDTEIGQAPTFNATGGLSLRFQICGATCSSTVAPEQPSPPFSGAGLSVTRLILNLAGTIEQRVNCDVDDSGGANPDRPVFRVAGNTLVFNLNTPLLGDPNACGLANLSNGQSALFAITAFSHGGTFNKTTILVKLQK